MFGITIIDNNELTALNAQLKRIESKIDKLILSAGQELERDMAERDEIDNLMAKVQQNTDAVQSAQTAMQGFVEITQKLTDELNSAVAEDNSAAIKAAADALSANNDQLLAAIPPMAQAIKANTRS
jgi:hypothetical protein